MPVPRRLAVLAASGLVALAPAAPAFAQSAGDEQYADPLEQPAPAPAPAPSAPAPAPAPEAPSSGAAAESAGAGTAAAESSGAAAPAATPRATAPAAGSGLTELPRTGLDVGVVALLGTALVLLGIGLRLRTADARP